MQIRRGLLGENPIQGKEGKKTERLAPKLVISLSKTLSPSHSNLEERKKK
jgi:hypothetical protein